MVRGAFALDLDEDGEVEQVLAIPAGKGAQELQAVALRVHLDIDARPLLGVGGGRLVVDLPRDEAPRRNLKAIRADKLERVPLGVQERVLDRVKAELSRKGNRSHQLQR